MGTIRKVTIKQKAKDNNKMTQRKLGPKSLYFTACDTFLPLMKLFKIQSHFNIEFYLNSFISNFALT